MVKQTNVTIKGKTYLVSFPSVGQLMEIESFKLVMSRNKYIQLSMSDMKNHTMILDIVDCVSYLSILIPDLKNDLAVKNWNDLDPFLAKELVHCYKKEFLPWFYPLLKDLYNYKMEEEDAEDEEQSER